MAISERKRRGAWYTPPELVATLVDAAIDAAFLERCNASGVAGRAIRVLDPACGDGRFLHAARTRIEAFGGAAHLTGFDIDPDAITEARERLGDADLVVADALGSHGVVGGDTELAYDVVIGNPPFLSQMAAATTRGSASRHGGGPYADAAVEFVALAADVVRPDGGRVAFVLPQSILSARDAQPIRRQVDERAAMIWSSWTGEREFDAQVLTCALVFEFSSNASPSSGDGRTGSWARVVTERLGVPPVPTVLEGAPVSTLGDRAWLNANFRDEYYGMVSAVGDHGVGPALITSGLIDPGVNHWGRRPVRFAKQKFAAPRIDVDRLDPKMRAWAAKRLVPKVMVANQTPILEAVCDPDGVCLPGVPVVSIYPTGPDAAAVAWEIAAVLTSASASVWAWHQRGGTGLSADTIRVGPVMLAALPWPTGPLDAAVAVLRAGDVVGCSELVDAAYGVDVDEAAAMQRWWRPILERVADRADRADR
ncbi:MAG: N-6 DNA methylase [Ilumatobacter sp.]|uniref:N-6 DNA methylase n=1 Tax=Ilumatobacter sp. TaxID=1967498 RepID=UPI00391A2367